MVAIVLCDDDPFTLQLLSELLERAIRQSKAEANLSVWPLLVRSRSSFIRSGGSYLYFLDYDLGRDSPQRRGPCPADLPHGPRRENRLLLPAMGRRAWIFCAAACGPLGLLKMCGSE